MSAAKWRAPPQVDNASFSIPATPPQGEPMQLLNPRITIQNTDTPQLLVTVEHDFSDTERIQLTVRVEREAQTISEIQRAAVKKSLKLLTLLQDSLDDHK